MAQCINRNAPEYLSLKEKAGVPGAVLDAKCIETIEKYGRFPYLDEIIGSDSEQHIKKTLKIRKNGATKIENILKATGSNNIEEAVINLNNQYRDKEITITPIGDEAIIDIEDRPRTYLQRKEVEKVVPSTAINPSIAISNTIDKLGELYGIKVHEVNDYILNQEEWQHLMPRDRVVNAFVYNGEIYINTDRASGDAYIHEMLHLLIGSLRFNKPYLYQDLIKQAEQFPNYEEFLMEYSGKTRNDANEEIFIQELSKYLAGMESDLKGLSEDVQYEITYNIHRVLDSMLMGTLSTKTIPTEQLFNNRLKDVVNYTNSPLLSNMSNKFDRLDAELHRKLNNMKSDLKRRNLLEEYVINYEMYIYI